MDCQYNQKKTRIDEQESEVFCLNKATFSCPVFLHLSQFADQDPLTQEMWDPQGKHCIKHCDGSHSPSPEEPAIYSSDYMLGKG